MNVSLYRIAHKYDISRAIGIEIETFILQKMKGLNQKRLENSDKFRLFIGIPIENSLLEKT